MKKGILLRYAIFGKINIETLKKASKKQHQCVKYQLTLIMYVQQTPAICASQSADPASLRLALCYTPFGPIYCIQ